MVARVRYVLSLPLYALQIVIALALSGLMYAARGLRWTSNGGQIHVFYPIVQLRRLIVGKPTWMPIDALALNIQPRTDAHRAVADADERLLKIVCDCGRPDCLNKEGRYVAKGPVVRITRGKE